ncbi:MAG TPA: hypothetical protein VMP67_06185 [Candidatus Limnocylindria bacterium]|nr:hypothetical protein [Candidatus Limnocylindria bacterium]
MTDVRFLGLHRAEPIVIFPDGRIEVVPRARVRLLSRAELP